MPFLCGGIPEGGAGYDDYIDGPGCARRLSALSLFHSKSVLYGAFAWARRVLNRQKRRFSARAVPAVDLSAAMDAINAQTGKPYEAPSSLKRRFQEAGGVSGARCREDDCACRPLE